MNNIALTPNEIVQQLDRYIIGQTDAKKAIAVAIRNRWRMMQLPTNVRKNISPKNILMIGPTGSDKTELARRMSVITNAPFIKVEMTKFTEVGYVGRDVTDIIKDLVETNFNNTKLLVMKNDKRNIGHKLSDHEKRIRVISNIIYDDPMLFKNKLLKDLKDVPKKILMQKIRERLNRDNFGGLSELKIGVSIDDISDYNGNIDEQDNFVKKFLGEDFWDQFIKSNKRHVTVSEAYHVVNIDREFFDNNRNEAHKTNNELNKKTIEYIENHGIVFLDEVDKLISKGNMTSKDISGHGVQRDLLPIVEGSAVKTKHGMVNTDNILFIAAGAFHYAKPDQLMPELLGRFPITVSLNELTQEDYSLILTQTEKSLVKQYELLMKTEGIRLKFTKDGIDEIAKQTFMMNKTTQNIGARRLYSIMERVLQDLSFRADTIGTNEFVIDDAYVLSNL